MEQNFSYNKQLGKQITVRAVMNDKNRMLEADIDKNLEKIDEITRENNRIKTAIPKRSQEGREHREISLRLNA